MHGLDVGCHAASFGPTNRAGAATTGHSSTATIGVLAARDTILLSEGRCTAALAIGPTTATGIGIGASTSDRSTATIRKIATSHAIAIFLGDVRRASALTVDAASAAGLTGAADTRGPAKVGVQAVRRGAQVDRVAIAIATATAALLVDAEVRRMRTAIWLFAVADADAIAILAAGLAVAQAGSCVVAAGRIVRNAAIGRVIGLAALRGVTGTERRIAALTGVRIAFARTGKAQRRGGALDIGMPAAGLGVAGVVGTLQIIPAALRLADAVPAFTADEVMPGQPVAAVQVSAIGIEGAADLVAGDAVVSIGAATAADGVSGATQIGGFGTAWTEIVRRATLDPGRDLLAQGGTTTATAIQTPNLGQAPAALFFPHAVVGILATGVVAAFGIARADIALVVTAGRTTIGIALG